MLKLYYQPISHNSRRVWITLLEKNLPFELVQMQLNGDQFQPDFLALNPFHQVPVLIDDDFRIIESLAILDYLEAKYPTPSLLPKDPKELAIVRMVQLITLNELSPALNPFVRQMVGFEENDPQKLEQGKEKLVLVLNFFDNLLDDHPFFGRSDSITFADIVAGLSISWLPQLNVGISLDNYPKLKAWCNRLIERNSWQKTQPSPEIIEAFKSQVKEILKSRQSR